MIRIGQTEDKNFGIGKLNISRFPATLSENLFGKAFAN
jgi:hypothetical protein